MVITASIIIMEDVIPTAAEGANDGVGVTVGVGTDELLGLTNKQHINEI